MLSLRIFALPAVWLAVGLSWVSAQHVLPVAQAVQQFREQGGRFRDFELLLPASLADAAVQQLTPNAQFLTLDPGRLSDHHADLPAALTLQLPYHAETLTLDLLETSIHTPDFSVITSTSGDNAVPYATGRHYRGAVRGDGRSVAAISIFGDEIMGLIADDRHGNLVLGKLDLPDNVSRYILYPDSDLEAKQPFSCEVLEHGAAPKATHGGDHPEVSGCVRVYFESDYELFVNKGSVQATVNYLAGAFNQLATLYANEQISVALSQVFVWVTPDSYSTSSSSTAVNQFKALRKSFQGDIAHLVGIGGNNLGGIAYVDVLCVPSYAYAFSDIGTSYNSVPTYSWTVEVLTHEMGHNLGSPHTQSCSWPGGAIDNCFTTEGGCPPGPAPVNGGTIMSYCHLASYGINFNNGFGPLPGNKIRTEVSNAACLAGSCAPTGSCQAPNSLTVNNITGTGASISWSAVSGASSYNIQWRTVGAASWSSANNVSSPYTVGGLPANDEAEVRVQSVCAGGTSEYSYGVIFMTNSSGGGGSTCNTPGGMTATATSSSAANVSWSAVTGASAYQLSWKTASSSTWNAPVTVAATSYTISGLTASTAYNVRVAAVCANGTSAYASTAFTTLSSGGNNTCNAPGNLSASSGSQTSAVVTWSAVSGASYYQLSYKPSTSSSWSAALNLGGTQYTINNLTANTTYDIRMRTVCTGGKSGYVTTTVKTQPGGVSGAACATPSPIVLHSLSSTSAVISWGLVTGAMSYDMQIKNVNSSSWLTFIGIPVNKVQIINLTPSQSYQVRVRARCSDNITVTPYTAIFTINTPANIAGAIAENPASDDAAVLRMPDSGTALAEAPAAHVYPNPTTGFVIFDPPSPADNPSVEWYDLNGRRLSVPRTESDSELLQYDLTLFPPGVYLMRYVQSDGKMTVQRVVKQ